MTIHRSTHKARERRYEDVRRRENLDRHTIAPLSRTPNRVIATYVVMDLRCAWNGLAGVGVGNETSVTDISLKELPDGVIINLSVGTEVYIQLQEMRPLMLRAAAYGKLYSIARDLDSVSAGLRTRGHAEFTMGPLDVVLIMDSLCVCITVSRREGTSLSPNKVVPTPRSGSSAAASAGGRWKALRAVSLVTAAASSRPRSMSLPTSVPLGEGGGGYESYESDKVARSCDEDEDDDDDDDDEADADADDGAARGQRVRFGTDTLPCRVSRNARGSRRRDNRDRDRSDMSQFAALRSSPPPRTGPSATGPPSRRTKQVERENAGELLRRPRSVTTRALSPVIEAVRPVPQASPPMGTHPNPLPPSVYRPLIRSGASGSPPHSHKMPHVHLMNGADDAAVAAAATAAAAAAVSKRGAPATRVLAVASSLSRDGSTTLPRSSTMPYESSRWNVDISPPV
jgi:hypothetical protein